MNIDHIKELCSSMNEQGFQELELEINNIGKLKLVLEDSPSDYNKEAKLEHDTEEEVFPSTQIEIRSDKIGSFSFANKQIKTGDPIKKDEVIGIVDGISFKEKIKCSVDGLISSINIAEGEVVDYGRLLFIIDI